MHSRFLVLRIFSNLLCPQTAVVAAFADINYIKGSHTVLFDVSDEALKNVQKGFALLRGERVNFG
ncbi:hypothetical protein HY416_01830 [Candidatus Kaiserbacteria bacterium]|nr:hypothetical protein [Candidatus Kaiserbacteria bacterium]